MGPCAAMYADLKAFYDRPYNVLSSGEKDALTVLGVSKTAWNMAKIDFNRGSWDSLTDEELVAAKHLGFSLFTWEKCKVDVNDYRTFPAEGGNPEVGPQALPEINEHFATTSQPPTP